MIVDLREGLRRRVLRLEGLLSMTTSLFDFFILNIFHSETIIYNGRMRAVKRMEDSKGRMVIEWKDRHHLRREVRVDYRLCLPL